MQSERNFLRALPRRFCSSAFIEHAFAFSLLGAKGFARLPFFSAFTAAVGSAGAAVCANVVVAQNATEMMMVPTMFKGFML